MQDAGSVSRSEEALNHSHIGRPLVARETLHEDAAVLFFQDAVVEQHEQAAVVKRTDEASEALLQGDDCGGHLILKERIATLAIDCFHTRSHDRIARNCERQPVDDHATELLTLHVYTLPEGRCREQDSIRRKAKLLEQSALRGITLTQHWKLDFSQKPLINVIHLRVAGKKYKGPATGDFEQPANAVSGFGPELGSAGIRQVRGDVEQRLALVVKM